MMLAGPVYLTEEVLSKSSFIGIVQLSEICNIIDLLGFTVIT